VPGIGGVIADTLSYVSANGWILDWLTAPFCQSTKSGEAEMKRIVKKKTSKKTESKIPLGGSDRNLLARVSFHLHRLAKIERFSPKQWKEDVEAYFGGRCAYCERKVPQLEKEHIIPINREGLGLRHNGNIIPACSICNQEKKKYDEESNNGYVRFCKANGYNKALAKIRQYMKERGYKPFTTDETKKKRIARMMRKAREKMTSVREDCAKKIARQIAKMIK
jgi:5-methylcytosine-specific restriction endonuclease McrA